MAKRYVYHLQHSSYLENVQDHQRLLLFCLIHAINCEQEIAAPMAISHLKGSGEKYCSHQYSPIYWSSFVGALLHEYPELCLGQQ